MDNKTYTSHLERIKAEREKLDKYVNWLEKPNVPLMEEKYKELHSRLGELYRSLDKQLFIINQSLTAST